MLHCDTMLCLFIFCVVVCVAWAAVCAFFVWWFKRWLHDLDKEDW